MEERDFEKLEPTAATHLIRCQMDNGTSAVFEIRQETHSRPGSEFHRAQARLLWREACTGVYPAAEPFKKLTNTVQVTVDVAKGTAQIGPTSVILMDHPGRGLGSHLMSLVVAWLMERHPEARVLRGKLSAAQADDENRERRNRFYESHGFDMELDPGRRSGGFSKARAGDLKVPPSKVEEFALDKLAEMYAETLKGRRDAEWRAERLTEFMEGFRSGVRRRNRAGLVLAAAIVAMVAHPPIAVYLHAFSVALAEAWASR